MLLSYKFIILILAVALSACGGGSSGPPADTNASDNCVIGTSTIDNCKI